MRIFLSIAKNDIRLIIKEPLTLMPHFVAPLFFLGVSLFIISQTSSTEQYLYSRHFTIVLGILSSTLSLAFCADSFAGERERNTLEILLSLPASLSTIYWAKVLGILPIPLFFGFIWQFLIWIGTKTFNYQILSWQDQWMCLLITLISVIFLTSTCTLISMKVQTVRTAAQISGILALFYLFGMQFVIPWFFKSHHLSGLIFLGIILVCLIIFRLGRLKFEGLLKN